MHEISPMGFPSKADPAYFVCMYCSPPLRLVKWYTVGFIGLVQYVEKPGRGAKGSYWGTVPRAAKTSEMKSQQATTWLN